MAQIVARHRIRNRFNPRRSSRRHAGAAGASLRFLSIKAIDGSWSGALWQSETKPPVDTTIIVQVHGSGGNLASLPLRAIARPLHLSYAGITEIRKELVAQTPQRSHFP